MNSIDLLTNYEAELARHIRETFEGTLTIDLDEKDRKEKQAKLKESENLVRIRHDRLLKRLIEMERELADK